VNDGGADPIRVAVVGLGRWGPNVARNLNSIAGCELAYCCDLDPGNRERWATSFPNATFTDDLDAVLADDSVRAVAVTTPVPTHAPVAERVINAGKDCFVEKPLADSIEAARRVYDAAASRDAVLMVGHLLEYHPAVTALRGLMEAGDLGDPLYVYSQRLNLGQLRADENALWSLGPHDAAVVLALVGETPVEVSARGESYVRDGVEDVVFGYMRFPSGLAAHLHLSWLDPHKERRITVVGSKRMATFDDMALDRKLTIYDKGFDPNHRSYGEYITRSGETRSPAIPNTESLRIECEHFVECVRDRSTPRTDGESGLRVVAVLEGMQRSLEQGGIGVEPSALAAANPIQ
jgi:predicted dehydrogenase